MALPQAAVDRAVTLQPQRGGAGGIALLMVMVGSDEGGGGMAAPEGGQGSLRALNFMKFEYFYAINRFRAPRCDIGQQSSVEIGKRAIRAKRKIQRFKAERWEGNNMSWRSCSCKRRGAV